LNNLTQEFDQGVVAQFVGNGHGNLAVVKQMLEENPALLNAVWEQFNETAIQAATQTGARDVAELLLAHGAPMDITTAAMLGDTDKVEDLLKQDPSRAKAKGSHDIPIMSHAAMSGNTRIADLLLAHGGGEGMDFALHGAVNFGHAEMVNWLLAHGVKNVNVRNYEGKTPLTVALEKGFYDIADMLQSEGATE
jgi:ankyrin repeat protein